MTVQTPEILIYQGTDLMLCCEPLADFPFWPKNRWKLYTLTTNLYRGYVGTWAIEEDHLYLKALFAERWRGNDLETVSYADLFPDYPDGIFAHWYTGELRCPRGAILKYVHGGFGSIYEEELYLRVKRGVLINERIVRNGTAPQDAKTGNRINAMAPTPTRNK